MITGVGTDIVEVARIAKAIERWGDHFLKHVYAEEEISYCSRHKFAVPHFAGRFAAKEAIIKALPDTDGLEWTDIRITNDPKGKPICHIAKKKFKGQIQISISHTKSHAIAFAVITA